MGKASVISFCTLQDADILPGKGGFQLTMSLPKAVSYRAGPGTVGLEGSLPLNQGPPAEHTRLTGPPGPALPPAFTLH